MNHPTQMHGNVTLNELIERYLDKMQKPKKYKVPLNWVVNSVALDLGWISFTER